MTVVDLYTIQIIYEDGPYSYDARPGAPAGYIEDGIAETEENLTDLLPPGYRARIRRWDDNEGTDDE